MDLTRLLQPRSVAVVGGGAWCENVLRQCRSFGFKGALWAVHPTRPEVAGVPAVRAVEDLPMGPDACFIGVNRHATVEVVAALAAMGAGGAVCFASGFQEAVSELSDGPEVQRDLVRAAGDMPILGPNCYGVLNAIDRVALWPDQHGLAPVDRGVAIVGQSSNVALNLTMHRRGLPIAYVATVGNQAQIGSAEIGRALLRNPRVTALGLHIEGFGDVQAWARLAEDAQNLGKPIVALKAGASDQARAAMVSHTASLAGSDAGGRAVLARLGIGQVDGLGAFLEALKLLHVVGPLASNKIASMSCSGGEAGLMADTGLAYDIVFPPLEVAQAAALRAALGPKVALANPLDYHTYAWGNRAALTDVYAAMMTGDVALGLVVLDFPRADRCDASDWDLVVDAVADAQARAGKPIALLASLPETMPEAVAVAASARGVVTLTGLPDALAAIAVASRVGRVSGAGLWALTGQNGALRLIPEGEAKARLSLHGLEVPSAVTWTRAQSVPEVRFPVAVKGLGLAHKTEAGAVVLGVRDRGNLEEALRAMPTDEVLIEEMIEDGVAELLIGVLADPPNGYLLTLGAGGTRAELIQDTVHLILPVTRQDIEDALGRLRMAPLLDGYRGAAPARRDAIVAAVLAVQDYVEAARDRVVEVEVNPLMCTPTRAVAVDAMIRERDGDD